MQIIVVYHNGEKILYLSMKKFIETIANKIVDSISGLEVTTHKKNDLTDLLEEALGAEPIKKPKENVLSLIEGTEQRKVNGSRQ